MEGIMTVHHSEEVLVQWRSAILVGLPRFILRYFCFCFGSLKFDISATSSVAFANTKSMEIPKVTYVKNKCSSFIVRSPQPPGDPLYIVYILGSPGGWGGGSKMPIPDLLLDCFLRSGIDDDRGLPAAILTTARAHALCLIAHQRGHSSTGSRRLVPAATQPQLIRRIVYV